MSRLLLLALLALVLLPSAHAQNISEVVFDVTADMPDSQPVASVFRVDNASGFVAKGILGVGSIPFTGAGERLMWHPYKAAFRAGSIGNGGEQWDESNIGFYTWAGGYNTTATGIASIAMGYQAKATGSYGSAFGYLAEAGGTGAVAMGYRSFAGASYSIAIGQRAVTCATINSSGCVDAGYTGAIVFADASSTTPFAATSSNQFSVRSVGGVRLVTACSGGSVTEACTPTAGVQLNAGGSSWNVVSDRNRKEAFAELDGEALLGRLAALPVTTWRYKAEDDQTVRHVGPMAQDWHRLVSAPLGLNADSLTINQGDFDGINLAGVVALEARTGQLAAENAARREELGALRAERASLREARLASDERFARLEAVVARLAPAAPQTVLTAARTEEAPRP